MTDRDDNITATATGDDSPVEVPRVEGSDNHWLTRPATIRKLWLGFSIVLAITVLLQAVVKEVEGAEYDPAMKLGQL